jgi:hypothetical protein
MISNFMKSFLTQNETLIPSPRGENHIHSALRRPGEEDDCPSQEGGYQPAGVGEAT